MMKKTHLSKIPLFLIGIAILTVALSACQPQPVEVEEAEAGEVSEAADEAEEVVSGTADMRIALSNNFAGNSWRQTMLDQWESVTSQAVEDGIVAEVDAFTTAENEATEQAAQIQDLILQGYDAIVINAASPTALNGVVKEACDAGIVVVSFDGIVTEPCAWRLAVDFKGMGLTQMEFVAEQYPDGGNLLEVRGLAGTSIDEEISAGIAEGVDTYGFDIVGTVHGDWTQTVAQREVAGILPGLPEIDAVVTQGGDGVGTIQAFNAEGRDVPLVIFGNRYDELVLWQELAAEEGGYDTMSLSIAPGVGTLAFWVAQQILDGNEPPKDLIVPFDVITADTLEERLAETEEGAVATRDYSLEDALEVIEAAK